MSAPTKPPLTEQDLRAAWAQKTKPLGSLGQLENLGVQLGLIQQSLTPELRNPHCLVFAADHGVAASGVSAYPASVTRQMALNFLKGGAAINVLCRQHHVTFRLVDAGIDGTLPDHPHLIAARVGNGTRNITQGPAMEANQLGICLQNGASIVKYLHGQGCNVLLLGEMGIGNTTSAAAIVSRLLQLPAEETVGRGTGVDDAGLERKLQAVKKALQLHWTAANPLDVLQALGGYEIAMLTAAMLQAGRLGMTVLVDGYIVSAAALVAAQLEPAVRKCLIFSHQSVEPGHKAVLAALQAEPLLKLDLRLGEASGAALAYPLLVSACALLGQMATFSDAGVSGPEA